MKLDDPRLIAIRARMADALRREDIPAYHAAGVEHRALLHAARPDIKAQWNRCQQSK